MVRTPLAAALVLLGACAMPVSEADRAELANLAPWNVVPKSSPGQLVAAFRRYCLDGPKTPRARDAVLRDGGYVPTGPARGARGRLYLTDDRRPAVAVGPRICLVQARARTGQSERVADHVAATVAGARPLDPRAFETGVERAWSVAGPDPAIIATRRSSTLGRRNAYAVILFRPD